MKDSDILKIARRINKHQQAILDLIEEIKQSDHPNAAQIVHTLEENIFVNASAVHCVHSFFCHPELYELDGFDITKRERRNSVQSQQSPPDFENEDAHVGDIVFCKYCGREFELTDLSSEHVSAGVYWCGCPAEQES